MSGPWGCSIFRLRAGESPFSGYEVTSPADLLRVVIQTLGDVPSWGEMIFDYYGQPAKDSSKGEPLEVWGNQRFLTKLVYSIWDQPEGYILDTNKYPIDDTTFESNDNRPYPPCFSNAFWKPSATKAGNMYLECYSDETSQALESLPKILQSEAILLYDLISKIFVYDPSSRLTASEMLKHPWFTFDEHISP